eukprot:jgi/Botrbrau1/18872/Bobra.177_2s0032.1
MTLEVGKQERQPDDQLNDAARATTGEIESTTKKLQQTGQELLMGRGTLFFSVRHMLSNLAALRPRDKH